MATATTQPKPATFQELNKLWGSESLGLDPNINPVGCPMSFDEALRSGVSKATAIASWIPRTFEARTHTTTGSVDVFQELRQFHGRVDVLKDLLIRVQGNMKFFQQACEEKRVPNFQALSSRDITLIQEESLEAQSFPEKKAEYERNFHLLESRTTELKESERSLKMSIQEMERGLKRGQNQFIPKGLLGKTSDFIYGAKPLCFQYEEDHAAVSAVELLSQFLTRLPTIMDQENFIGVLRALKDNLQSVLPDLNVSEDDSSSDSDDNTPSSHQVRTVEVQEKVSAAHSFDDLSSIWEVNATGLDESMNPNSREMPFNEAVVSCVTKIDVIRDLMRGLEIEIGDSEQSYSHLRLYQERVAVMHHLLPKVQHHLAIFKSALEEKMVQDYGALSERDVRMIDAEQEGESFESKVAQHREAFSTLEERTTQLREWEGTLKRGIKDIEPLLKSIREKVLQAQGVLPIFSTYHGDETPLCYQQKEDKDAVRAADLAFALLQKLPSFTEDGALLKELTELIAGFATIISFDAHHIESDSESGRATPSSEEFLERAEY